MSAAPGLTHVDVGGMPCVDFLSDVHLQVNDPATYLAWSAYLQTTPAQAVFILGDLFEVWVGDDVLSNPLGAFEQRCVRDLHACSQQRALYFMHGNRDFLCGEGFFASSQATALADPCVLSSAAGPVLLSHGDAWCTDDAAYQAFRMLVRSQAWQTEFLAQTLQQRLSAALSMRAQSKVHQQSMARLSDVDNAACSAALEHAACQLSVHGHTHQPACHDLGKGQTRWVLSDWHAEQPQPRLEVLRLQNGVLQRLPLAGRG